MREQIIKAVSSAPLHFPCQPCLHRASARSLVGRFIRYISVPSTPLPVSVAFLNLFSVPFVNASCPCSCSAGISALYWPLGHTRLLRMSFPSLYHAVYSLVKPFLPPLNFYLKFPHGPVSEFCNLFANPSSYFPLFCSSHHAALRLSLASQLSSNSSRAPPSTCLHLLPPFSNSKYCAPSPSVSPYLKCACSSPLGGSGRLQVSLIIFPRFFATYEINLHDMQNSTRVSRV
jgi:hypothetical protein